MAIPILRCPYCRIPLSSSTIGKHCPCCSYLVREITEKDFLAPLPNINDTVIFAGNTPLPTQHKLIPMIDPCDKPTRQTRKEVDGETKRLNALTYFKNNLAAFLDVIDIHLDDLTPTDKLDIKKRYLSALNIFTSKEK